MPDWWTGALVLLTEIQLDSHHQLLFLPPSSKVSSMTSFTGWLMLKKTLGRVGCSLSMVSITTGPIFRNYFVVLEHMTHIATSWNKKYVGCLCSEQNSSSFFFFLLNLKLKISHSLQCHCQEEFSINHHNSRWGLFKWRTPMVVSCWLFILLEISLVIHQSKTNQWNFIASTHSYYLLNNLVELVGVVIIFSVWLV